MTLTTLRIGLTYVCVMLLMLVGRDGDDLRVAEANPVTIQPPSKTPMGVVSIDNEKVKSGTTLVPWQAPLGGYYWLKSSVPVIWQLGNLPAPSPDPAVAQNPSLIMLWAPGSSGPPGQAPTSSQWAKLNASSSGWVHIELYDPITLQKILDAWYVFYEVVIIEDDVGGRQGHDLRYGCATNSWFPEAAGRYVMMNSAEPAASSIQGYNDLYDEMSTKWTGLETTIPTMGGFIRPWRWMPETQVLSVDRGSTPEEKNWNSLLAVSRTDSYVRVWIKGPRDSSISVPVHLRITPAGNSTLFGQVEPGLGPNPPTLTYDIQPPPFQPPNKMPPNTEILQGGTTWGPPPGGPWRSVVSRYQTYNPPTAGLFSGLIRGQQILRIPWKGKVTQGSSSAVRYLSSTYGDIEVEAAVIPVGWPNGLAKQYGADNTFGEWEGVIAHRRGTVVELQEVEVETREPEITPSASRPALQDEWFRMMRFKLRRPVVDEERLSLSLGVNVSAGGDWGSRPTQTSKDLWVRLNWDSSAELDYSEKYLAEEAMIPVVNAKIDTDLETRDWGTEPAVWIVGEVPSDIEEPWFESDGETRKRPDSLELHARGYAGVVLRNPGKGDFDTEKPEFEDTPPNLKCDVKFAQHFMNVLADVNNDGLLNLLDDQSEALEESTTTGLFVNAVRSGEAGTPQPDDANCRRMLLRFSQPVGQFDYASHEVWLSCSTWQALGEGAAMGFPLVYFTTRDGAGIHTPLEWNSVHKAFKLSLAELYTGPEVEVYVWCDPESTMTSTTLEFYLTEIDESNSDGKWQRIALDTVGVRFYKWGLNVDSDNNGTIDSSDDSDEEQKLGLLVFQDKKDGEGETVAYELQLVSLPALTKMISDHGLSNVQVELKKTTDEGRVIILDCDDQEFMSATDQAAILVSDMQDLASEMLTYKVVADGTDGCRGGDVTLTLELSVFADNAWSTLAQDVAQLYVFSFKLKEVHFGGDSDFQNVEEDGLGTAYSAPHWQDNTANGDNDADDTDSENGSNPADRKFPVTYVRAKTVKVKADISSTDQFLSDLPEGVEVQGVRADDMDLSEPTVSTSGTTVSTAFKDLGDALPDRAWYYDEFTIDWQVSLDGGTVWHSVGVSDNRMYVTVAKALTKGLDETVLDIACRHLGNDATNPVDSASKAFDKIWAYWQSGKGTTGGVKNGVERKQVNGFNRVTPAAVLHLEYWSDDPAKWNNTVCKPDPDEMLRDETNATCGSLSRIFIRSLRAHGIGSAEIILIRPYGVGATASTNKRFFVKNWHTTGAGGSTHATAAYPWVRGIDLIDDAGVPGQTTNNPNPVFHDHCAVKYDSTWYDPSYGTEFSSEIDHEKGSIWGVGEREWVTIGGSSTWVYRGTPASTGSTRDLTYYYGSYP